MFVTGYMMSTGLAHVKMPATRLYITFKKLLRLAGLSRLMDFLGRLVKPYWLTDARWPQQQILPSLFTACRVLFYYRRTNSCVRSRTERSRGPTGNLFSRRQLFSLIVDV